MYVCVFSSPLHYLRLTNTIREATGLREEVLSLSRRRRRDESRLQSLEERNVSLEGGLSAAEEKARQLQRKMRQQV